MPALHSFTDKERMRGVMNHRNKIYSDMHFDLPPITWYLGTSTAHSRPNPLQPREGLGSLMRGQLMAAGVAANVCVESTARDAMQLDYVVMISDGVMPPMMPSWIIC
jgi:hypothetical protein